MNWETVLSVAFATIGIMEYLKGFKKDSPKWAWRLLQPVLCLILAAVSILLPGWVMTGILALALSQVGYQVIIEAVKKRIKEA